MTHPAPQTDMHNRLLLADERGLGRLTVDMQSFFEFSFWIAEELEELVSRHESRQRRLQAKSRDRD